MKPETRTSFSLSRALRYWWRCHAASLGKLGAARKLAAELWDFLLDFIPARRRRRYGDIDYDWDYRVDTSEATLDRRTRLRALLTGGPYQPSDPGLFHHMLDALPVDYSQFTFLDLGSGKGRALLMASDYPFRRILGVELVPELHRVAQDNIRRYHSPGQRCRQIESHCGDAGEFQFPPEPSVLYLFNPFPESLLRQVLAKLETSLRECPRPIYLIYHNPLLEAVLAGSSRLRRLAGTHQFTIYSNVP